MSVIPSNVTLRLSNTLMMLSSMLSVLGILSLNLDFLNEPPAAPASLSASTVQNEAEVIGDNQTAYPITGSVKKQSNAENKPTVLTAITSDESIALESPGQSTEMGLNQEILSQDNFFIPLAGSKQLMSARITQ